MGWALLEWEEVVGRRRPPLPNIHLPQKARPMAHPRIYDTEGVVLRRSDFGEADRILTQVDARSRQGARRRQGRPPDDQPQGRAPRTLHADAAVAGHWARP